MIGNQENLTRGYVSVCYPFDYASLKQVITVPFAEVLK
jgi:hypothetical protein